MPLSKAQLLAWLGKLDAVYAAKKDYLTDLDAAIGDADHGINMHRGFGKVMEKLPPVADKDIGTILKTVGMTLMSSVGGASGPLYGTFWMKPGMLLLGKEALDAPWLSLFPGLAILVTVLGYNLLGESLRDILDPRLKR